jgi:NAD-specific glutamate dehydrogenase
VRAAIHPIITIDGVRTSIIALVCDAIVGEQRKTLSDGLRDAFMQGAIAVRDWKPMLARLKEARDGLAAQPPKSTNVSE